MGNVFIWIALAAVVLMGKQQKAAAKVAPLRVRLADGRVLDGRNRIPDTIPGQEVVEVYDLQKVPPVWRLVRVNSSQITFKPPPPAAPTGL